MEQPETENGTQPTEPPAEERQAGGLEPQPPPPPPQESPAGTDGEFVLRPRISGLAIASLSVSVIGLGAAFMCFPAPLIGLGLGIWSLRRIRTSHGMERGHGMAIAAIVISSVGIAGVVLFFGVIRGGMWSAMRGFGPGNFQQIRWGFRNYLNANDGRAPEFLEDLYPEYVSSTAMFIVPQDDDPVRTTGGFLSSYRYVGPLNCRGQNVIVAYERANFGGSTRNVLTLSGAVSDAPESEFRSRLKQSFEKVKARNWDQYPVERREEIEAFYALP